MGAQSSKAEPPSQHVFNADAPVRFSEGLVNSLQSNRETDSTRAKNAEQIIEARVTAELQKRLESSKQKLSSSGDAISEEPFVPAKEPDKPLFLRLSEKVTGGSDSDTDKYKFNPNLDSTKVGKEVEELRRKLTARKKVVQTDKEVESAKENVIICLKQNDRRPLDCWKEVEKFKMEVSRLERTLIDKNSF